MKYFLYLITLLLLLGCECEWESPTPDITLPEPSPTNASVNVVAVKNEIIDVMTATDFYQGILDHAPNPATLNITVGGYWFTEFGDGNLLGPSGTSGTINYVSGYWTIQFGVDRPAAGQAFLASYSYNEN